jgi:DNA polymerase IV (DinB-like DNA polymerase)
VAQRIIFLVDMDYFYAQVEMRERPELKGTPVVVGADPREGRGRGVIATCSYEARKYGLHSAMPIAVAWRKCPSPPCTYLPLSMELYARVSSRVMAILQRHADTLEQVSIDEAYLDVSSAGSWEQAEALARAIKREVLEKERLTCSVGIGPNKLIAKIAAGRDKPDGLTLVRPEQVPGFLGPLGVRELPGVGPKTEAVLHAMGAQTITDLRKLPEAELVRRLGTFGHALAAMARGRDDRPVTAEYEAKSLGRHHTFPQDTADRTLIMETLLELCRDIHQRLTDARAAFRTVTVLCRYEDFETHSKAKTLKFATDRLDAMYTTAQLLLAPFLKAGRKVRLIGASVSRLEEKR